MIRRASLKRAWKSVSPCITEKIIFMKNPSKEECYQLIYESGMLPNIVTHSLQVCRIATSLVDHLAAHGIKRDRELVQAGAMLHDIAKTQSLKTGENHAKTGAEMVRAMGYPDVAYIISHHVVLDENFVSDRPAEVEIVNYADKRVLHDKVVSLRERMDDILVRYAKQPIDKEFIVKNWRRVKELEEKLFVSVAFSPDDLDSLSGLDSLHKAIQEYHDFCSRFLHPSLPVSNSFDEFPQMGVNSTK
jgi:uncharacterized protein